MLKKQEGRYRRHKRTRAKISGRADRPRLCVFRSAQHIYAQLINDEKGKTILSASDKELKGKTSVKGDKENKSEARKIAIAKEVGKIIAEKAIENKIKTIVFDRGGYKYYGRVKALAEGAREGGLKF